MTVLRFEIPQYQPPKLTMGITFIKVLAIKKIHRVHGFQTRKAKTLLPKIWHSGTFYNLTT